MEFRIEQKEAFRIVGISEPLSKDLEENFKTVPTMWQNAGTSGVLGKLIPMMNSQPMGVLGVSACGNESP